VVVTNQRGIALGQMTAADVAAVHDRLHELLAEQGARVDAIFVCPHDRGVCACRKPGTLMLERARDLLRLDSLRDCVMIGDSPTDVLAGRAAGARSVYLGAASDSMVPRGVEVAGSLLEAVQRMLETHPQTAAAAA
jgi:D-glycero-D-manno-heptose 1,7-bisphosphate phosphatase